jgi:hypothetical protein
MQDDAVRASALAAEFSDWEITLRPGGLDAVAAYWQTPDGRTRRYIVTRTPGELLAALRALCSNGPASRPGGAG